MLIIDNKISDPWFNLAAEEYLFRNFTGDIFMVYVNARLVVIGKHQNPLEEVNPRCLREENIPLIRRISGGGAVYHDEGNLNYTYISNTPEGKEINFSAYTRPIISFLKTLGIDAYAGEKNEIRTGVFKISGNAEHVFKRRVLHHGTILFSADLELMSRCLEKTGALINSRAVQSNRDRVCNLEKRMSGIRDIGQLKTQLLHYMSLTSPNSESYILTGKDIKDIKKISEEKFRTWEWNYAWGPDYTFSKTFSIGEYQLDLKMEISKGIIRECKLSGPSSWKKLEYLLRGKRHNYDNIARVITGNGLTSDSDLIYNFLM